jgi:hypothetical protein
MPRKVTGRLVRAVTEPLWKRDELEMRAVDAVLSIVERKRKRPSRHAAASKNARPKKRAR